MIEFWKEYKKMNVLERREKLKLVVDRFEEVMNSDVEKELKRQMLEMFLQSYFDDLIEVLEFHS